jgi:hypothetical protein
MGDVIPFPEQLLPTDDLLTPEEELAAAVEGALEGDPDPGEERPVIPFGRSWVMDWTADPPRFKRHGTAPAECRGLDSLKQWLEMARRTARDAHDVFSPEFGMDGPEDWMGHVDTDEAASDYGAQLEEAWLVHDRVSSVEDYRAHFETDVETIFIDELNVITDDETAGSVDMSGPAPLNGE